MATEDSPPPCSTKTTAVAPSTPLRDSLGTVPPAAPPRSNTPEIKTEELSSPPTPNTNRFGHGGKRVRNPDRSAYSTINFHQLPSSTVLKRVTWQEVLGSPYESQSADKRSEISNKVRAAARCLAQLLLANNTTPPTYTDQYYSVGDTPKVPAFCAPARLGLRVSRKLMAKYLNDLFPNTLDIVKDGKGGSCRCLNYWVAELILQSTYQRYARGLRLFYNFKVIASQESYPFGDIVYNGLKTWDLPEFQVLNVDPPGLSRAELTALLLTHPRQYDLAMARDVILGLGGGLPPETSDEDEGGDRVVGSSGDESSNATGDSNLVGSGGTLEGTEENPIVISDVGS